MKVSVGVVVSRRGVFSLTTGDIQCGYGHEADSCITVATLSDQADHRKS